MNEVAINGGDGLKKPHPALLDVRAPGDRPRDRQADHRRPRARRPRQGGADAQHVTDTSWTPDIPADQVFDFDLDKARQILEDAGYKDTDGDGVREMPGGGKPLNFTYYVRSDGETAPEIGEFVTGWLDEIGIATTKKVADDTQLTTIIGKGDYDMFDWGWTPFVDPDPMLVLHLRPGVERSRGPDQLLQRRELLRPRVRQALPAAEGRARPRQARADRPRDAHAPSSPAPTTCSTRSPSSRHTGRPLRGLRRQPAKIGPVVYQQTSPTYAR